jgi:hypothetical protein
MRRSKPKAKLKVADGAGGLLEVVDRRFDRVEWPISFQVPAAEAENWFHYLQFECERRGWSSAGMSQLQSRQNSGSLMLLDAGVEKLSVGIGLGARCSTFVPDPRRILILQTLKNAFGAPTSGAVPAQPNLNIAGASWNTRGVLGAASFGLATTFASGRRLSNMRMPPAGPASLW